MKIKLFKKHYLKNNVKRIILDHQFCFLIQYDTMKFKKDISLKKKFKKFDLNFKLLKNKSNFLIKLNSKIFILGQTCLISSNSKIIFLKNFFLFLNLIKKKKLILINFKFNNKMYTDKSLNKLSNIKTPDNLFNLLFFTLDKIKNPNTNLCTISS